MLVIFRMNAFIYVLRCAIRGFGNLCLPNLQATNINPSINFRMNVFIPRLYEYVPRLANWGVQYWVTHFLRWHMFVTSLSSQTI